MEQLLQEVKKIEYQIIADDPELTNDLVIRVLCGLARNINTDNRKKGFWNNPIMDKLLLLRSKLAGRRETEEVDDITEIINLVEDKMPDGRVKAEELALIHSEISEALEGVRKPQPSVKIPGFTLEEEEHADALIRYFDHIGGHKLFRVFTAVLFKLGYNRTREPLHGKKF